jgi:hypothetical protein
LSNLLLQEINFSVWQQFKHSSCPYTKIQGYQAWIFLLLLWFHDTQHNGTQHNDIQHNDTQHKGIVCDTQPNGTLRTLQHYAESHYAECRV